MLDNRNAPYSSDCSDPEPRRREWPWLAIGLWVFLGLFTALIVYGVLRAAERAWR